MHLNFIQQNIRVQKKNVAVASTAHQADKLQREEVVEEVAAHGQHHPRPVTELLYRVHSWGENTTRVLIHFNTPRISINFNTPHILILHIF